MAEIHTNLARRLADMLREVLSADHEMIGYGEIKRKAETLLEECEREGIIPEKA